MNLRRLMEPLEPQDHANCGLNDTTPHHPSLGCWKGAEDTKNNRQYYETITQAESAYGRTMYYVRSLSRGSFIVKMRPV
jgi:hypothetical protein